MAKFDPKTVLDAGSPRVYTAVIVLDRVTAGRPKDPKAFETLVRLQVHRGAPGTAQYEASESEIAERLLEPTGEAEVPAGTETIAREFSVMDGAPCIRGYQVFACLREALGVLAGNSPGYYSAFGAFKAGVFVQPDYIPLLSCAKREVQYSAGHVLGPRGDRSILKASEVVVGATAVFGIKVQPGVPASYFPEAVLRKLLETAQSIGLGSDRTLGSGRFTLSEFTVLA